MDKYEFNLIVEKLKKATREGDWVNAMNLADRVDWRRVSSVSLLSLVSEVYEKNEDIQEAKEILLIAYEQAPLGKRLLYKLTTLSIEAGEINEAEAFYREFYEAAPDDPRQHILRYLILKAKNAPIPQLINSLEQYNALELNERWLYELAELYHLAGRSEECVKVCDQIMLMFGIGQYVDKAIDLKKNKEGADLTDYQQSLIDNREKYEERLRSLREKEEDIPEPTAEEKDTAPAQFNEEADEVSEEPDSGVLAPEMKEEVPEENAATINFRNFLIERKSPEEGLERAKELLKQTHKETGSANQVAKINATKLNLMGVSASKEKLAGRDLLVEEAGDLSAASLWELVDLIKQEPEERVVVLVDNPMQVKNILSVCPEIKKLFIWDREEDEPAEQMEIKKEPEIKLMAQPAPKAQKAPKAQPEDEPEEETQEDYIQEAPKMNMYDKSAQMGIDEFADYCQEYARSIDCVIPGKSKLALYERIEIMEEDGIPLTQDNAIALIEETADKAENPTFAQKLSGLFSAQYDKDDRLILKESHFI